MKYHNLSSFKKEKFMFSHLWRIETKIKVPTGLVSGASCPSEVQMAALFLCFHVDLSYTQELGRELTGILSLLF